jgi:hypothetical protein
MALAPAGALILFISETRALAGEGGVLTVAGI